MQIGFIIVLCLSAIFFLTFLFLLKNNKQEGEESFNFRQYFIYEAFPKKKEMPQRIGQFLAISSNIILGILAFCLPHDETVTSPYYFLMVAIIEVIVELFFTFLSYTSFKKEKLRVATFMFYGAFIAIRNGTSGIILLSISRKILANNSALALTFAIISFVFAALSIAPLCNPKLANYAKLEEVIEKDGTSHYERPKYFVMAFSEWLLFFLSEFSLMATSLFFFFAS